MNRSGAPTTYNRITPDRGCGFILKRIAEISAKNRPPTKEQVYTGTKWANRPGFASLLWTSLMEDSLIASVDGKTEYNGAISPFSGRGRRYMRAKGHVENGKMVFRYYLLPKGREIYEEMMARVNKIREEKLAFCERNGIEFSTGKTLNAGGSVTEYDAKKDEKKGLLPLPTEEQKQWLHNWIAGLNETQEQERKFNAKQKLDAIINDLMDLRDSLS